MESGVKRPVTIAIGLALVATVAVVLAWSLAPRAAPDLPPGLTEVTDAPELERSIELSDLGILTSTNYLGHRIYTVRATLKNLSNSPIRLVDVKMTFRDGTKRVIQEEVHPAFEPKQRPLEPDTEYRFEVPFENPPREWNYHVPDTEVVRIGY